MLTLTENADAIVSTLVSQQTDGQQAGLRIQTADETGPRGEARLAVHVVAAPEPADEVIQATSGRVFVEPAVAEVLSDKVLDAGVDGNGGVSFTILPQA